MLVEPNRMNEEDDYMQPRPCQLAAAAASPLQSSPSVVVPILEASSCMDGQRRIHRVPPQMRLKKKETHHLFDPVLVSLGPYHHGEANLSRAEKLKDVILSKFLSESSKDKDFFYNKIVERIDEIRACYVEVSKEKFDDHQLAVMMLRDTVFIIDVIICFNLEYTVENLGISGITFLYKDLCMLENQIFESSNDVKKLREKKILFSCLGSDEEAVELFKQIDTVGIVNFHIFQRVKMDIDEHCSSRRRTWMADLIRTYFESPWSAIALLAASLLLFLTFSQTYLALLSHMSEDRKPPM